MAISLPKGQDASSLADWAELRLLTGSGRALSRARIISVLNDDGTEAAEAELAEEEDLDAEVPDEDLDAEVDARVDQLLDEIVLRRRVGSAVYPFETRGQRILRREVPGEQAYLLLLILSLDDAPYRAELRTHEVEHAYDRVALEALRRFLGRDAQAVRFARNSHDPDDPQNTRPKRFDEAIVWLRDKLDLGPGTGEAPTTEQEPHWEDPKGLSALRSYSDAGVDVVAWWRFEDGRIGFPVLLAQCTVQLKWERKLKDVDPDLWREWIHFGTVPPQKCLVIPFAVDLEEENWPHRTTQAGVILDRVRLVELLDELDEDALVALVDERTVEWIQAELDAVA